MKITLESQEQFALVDGIECRIWHGATQGGAEVIALIPLILTPKESDQSEFEAELREVPDTVKQTAPIDPKRVI
ncbi:hypothetical protein A7A08_01668 [Methyloligella halotolerans]|uniref:Uncharacterized protein n=1 Tax=Methyloligella halotolerans TaxID=1177755 RepID=A0A1E2RZI1_9HYPH|nr:hypothetical protein [Methyloligella halotolerans]ODA67633.1 hypothetical protein A7A08_01668 [Methyloligella halotolerans]